MTNFELIKQFHKKFDPIQDRSADIIELRIKLMQEEMSEFAEAAREMVADDNEAIRAHVLKELIDVLYITYGTIEKMGWDADAAFAEVHASNMSKTPNTVPNGKALKLEGYKLAEMERFVS